MSYEEIIENFQKATRPYASEDNLVKGYVVDDADSAGHVLVLLATTNAPDEDGYFTQQEGIYDCTEDIEEISGVRVYGSVQDLEEVVSNLSNPVPMNYLEG